MFCATFLHSFGGCIQRLFEVLRCVWFTCVRGRLLYVFQATPTQALAFFIRFCIFSPEKETQGGFAEQTQILLFFYVGCTNVTIFNVFHQRFVCGFVPGRASVFYVFHGRFNYGFVLKRAETKTLNKPSQHFFEH